MAGVVSYPRVGGAAVVLFDVGVVILSREMSDDVRDLLGEPAAMARRASCVGQAMPQADRGGNGVQFEPPRTEERAPVVPPALIPRVHPSRNPSARYCAASVP